MKRGVSDDSRVLTATAGGVNTNGEKLHEVEVYEEQ
jgi:hypothetical protein